MSSYKVDIKKNKTDVEITGEIPADIFESERRDVLKKLNDSVSIDGFRKGKIPEDVLIKHVGEMRVLEEMAQNALGKAYPAIMIEHKIDGIGQPEIKITKIAKDNPLGFTIKQAVLPEIKLPDVKKVAEETLKKSKDEAEEVSDEDVKKTLDQLRNMRKKDPKDEKEVAPALDDEFAKSLGDFQTVDDLKNKIKENIKFERELKIRDKKRLAVIEAIAKEAKLEIPEILIEREMDNLLNETKADISRMGLKFEEYLKHLKKSEKEVRDGFKDAARKRAETGLILDAIARDKNLKPDEALVTSEVEKVLSQYPGADEHGAKHYVEGVLKNEEVFKFLGA